MPRTINPKRDPATGDLYHYCPMSEGVRCYGAITVNCVPGCQLETLPTKYRVHCAVGSSEPIEEFTPPKAHDSYKGLKSPATIKSPTHIWVEPKLDGVRALVHIVDGEVHILSRRRDKQGQFGRMTANFPHLADDPWLTRQRGYTILDGELIMPADAGEPSLPLTMSVVGALPERAIRTQEERGYANFHVFDIPRFEGVDYTAKSLLRRREALEWFMAKDANRFHPHIVRVPFSVAPTLEEKQVLLASFLEQGFEGAVIKDPHATYFQSRAWLKVKQECTYDALVTGFDWGTPQGKYAATIGALRVSVRDAATRKLREICAVNPGDDATRVRLLEMFKPYDGCDLGHFQMVVELQGQLLTADGRIRHPRILRFRPDRSSPNTVDFTTGTVVA